MIAVARALRQWWTSKEPRVVLPLVCEQEDVMDGVIKVSVDIPVPRVVDELLDIPVSTVNEITNIPMLKVMDEVVNECVPERAVIHITDIPVLQMIDEVAKQRVPERRMEQDVYIHVSKTVGSTVVPRERGPERAAEQLVDVPALHVVVEALKVVRFVPQVEEQTLEVGTRSEEIADVFRCIAETRRQRTAMGIPQHPTLDNLEGRLHAVSCF